ncbi:MAG: hypothetical protein HFG28_06210 [Eubacterium sp.]|nr:hypothetical protein [Eubacterium sp.]
MNYEGFVQEVQRGVKEIVEKKLEDGIVVVRNVLKNNNVRMKAISIVRKDEDATPTIYLQNYYEEYQRGRAIKSICNEIYEIYLRGIDNFKTDVNIQDISDLEKMKEVIYYKVINYEMNKTLLSKIPHFKFLDLAIVFYIMMSKDDEGQATALIYNQHIAGWEITPEELRNIAFQNMWNNYPVVVRRMEDIVSEMILNDILGDEEWVDAYDDEYDEDCISEDTEYGEYTYGELKGIVREEVENLKIDDLNMYVMSNTMKLNGAACITYPGAIRDFALEHNSDVYIIPSSVHELILIPDIKCSIDTINDLIKDVNRRQLDPVEILSDHAYIYRLKTGEIE